MQTPRMLLLSLIVFCGSLLAQTNPIPFVNQPLVPETVAPGGNGFTLTVNGTGFVSGSVVKWNGSARSTTFISGSQLHAAISAADIASPSTAVVTVTSPKPGGGTSNAADFQVTLAAPGVQLLRKDISLNGGYELTASAVSDFNGDGKLDLAVASRALKNKPGRVFILLGDGLGHFSKAGFVSAEVFAEALITSDFNGDGIVDLALINARNEVAVFLGNGDGTFQSQRTFLTGVDPVALAAGDFNQDGKLDLAVSNSADNTISIMLGKGDGTFSRLDVPTGGIYPSRLATGDFNGDGQLDLAIVEGESQQVTIMLGNGDGTFAFSTDIFVPKPPSSVVVTDLNGDGQLDLLVSVNGSRSSYQAVLLGNGDGTFQDPKKAAIVPSPEQSAAVADMNGDGTPDLVTMQGRMTESADTEIWLGDGLGGYQREFDITAGSFSFDLPQAPVIADFNQDGKPDVAVLLTTYGYVTQLSQSSVLLTPQIINFGQQKIGKKSAPQNVTLTNAGFSSLAISGFKFVDGNAPDFSQTNDCPASLPSGGSCTIQITFKPTKQGKESTILRVSDDGPQGGQTVKVKGVGVN